MITSVIRYIKTDIWKVRLKDVRGPKRFLIRYARIVLLAVYGFRDDRDELRSSALTYYSLLAIVPVAALAFAVAKGFGLEQVLRRRLTSSLDWQDQVISRVTDFAASMIENTQGGVLAGVGVLLLLWIIIRLLGGIENSFNYIWGVKRPRSLARQFSDYISLTIIAPVLFVLSSSLTVTLSARISALESWLGVAAPVMLFLIRIVPYVIVWLLFTFVYVFVPNTRVQVTSGLLAGVVAGTLFQIVQFVYITFQVGVARYGAIYGSFAALPLFLVWMRISWEIVLFGAETAFVHQHSETRGFGPDYMRVNRARRRLYYLGILRILVRSFAEGGSPPNARAIAGRLEIPDRLCNHLIDELMRAGLVSETETAEGSDPGFQPARPVDRYTVSAVLDVMDSYPRTIVPDSLPGDLLPVDACLRDLEGRVRDAYSDVFLKSL